MLRDLNNWSDCFKCHMSQYIIAVICTGFVWSRSKWSITWPSCQFTFWGEMLHCCVFVDFDVYMYNFWMVLDDLNVWNKFVYTIILKANKVWWFGDILFPKYNIKLGKYMMALIKQEEFDK